MPDFCDTLIRRGLLAPGLFFLLASAPVLAGGGPLEAINGYYNKLKKHDCIGARHFRPSMSMKSCSQTTSISTFTANVLKNYGRKAVAYLYIEYTKAGRKHVFDGTLALEKTKNGSWIIGGAPYDSKVKSLQAYVRKYNIIPSRGARQARTTRTASPLGAAGQTLSARNARPAASPRHSAFGDSAVLKACFSPQSLRHKPGEERITRHGDIPGMYIPRPRRAKPLQTLRPLPNAWRGSIRRFDTHGRKVVALTFDLCERENEITGYDGRIIDTLRRNGVKATLFAGGKWMATHPVRTMQLIADPLFELGNHAWTHGNLRVLKGQAMRNQAIWTQAQYELIRERLERMPCFQRVKRANPGLRLQPALRTMRYPYGTCSREALNAMSGLGLASIQWDVVTADPWKGQTAAGILRAVSKAKPGSIIIMHANGRGWKTHSALPQVIRKLRARGFSFVTISEMMKLGKPVVAKTCYEVRPGDNKRYDRIFGEGTTAGKRRRKTKPQAKPHRRAGRKGPTILNAAPAQGK